MQTSGAVGAFALHFVGFVDQPQAKELLAEVALIQLAAKNRFIGSLQFGERELLW